MARQIKTDTYIDGLLDSTYSMVFWTIAETRSKASTCVKSSSTQSSDATPWRVTHTSRTWRKGVCGESTTTQREHVSVKRETCRTYKHATRTAPLV